MLTTLGTDARAKLTERALSKAFTMAFASPKFSREFFWSWVGLQVSDDELAAYRAEQFDSVFILWEAQFRSSVAMRLACDYPELSQKDLFFKALLMLIVHDNNASIETLVDLLRNAKS